jgi:hypothetical protein
MWTRFMDMHSGGDAKTAWNKIYIEAPEELAIEVFKSRFGRDPYHTTCTCCGEDFSISSKESFEQISGHDRGCDFGYFFKDTGEYAGKDFKSEFDKESLTWSCTIDGREVMGLYVEERGEYWKQYQIVEEYISNEDVRVIYHDEF